jgi:hypothetical protein
MKFGDYPKAGSFDGVAAFRSYVKTLGLDMPCDDVVESGPGSPLGKPLEFEGMHIGHRLGNSTGVRARIPNGAGIASV